MHKLLVLGAVCAIRTRGGDKYDTQIKEMFEGGTDNLLSSGSNNDISQDDVATFSEILTEGQSTGSIK